MLAEMVKLTYSWAKHAMVVIYVLQDVDVKLGPARAILLLQVVTNASLGMASQESLETCALNVPLGIILTEVDPAEFALLEHTMW